MAIPLRAHPPEHTERRRCDSMASSTECRKRATPFVQGGRRIKRESEKGDATNGA